MTDELEKAMTEIYAKTRITDELLEFYNVLAPAPKVQKFSSKRIGKLIKKG